MRDIVTAMEVDEEIGNLEEEKIAIIKEIAEVLERRRKDKLPALRDIPKKKLLEEKLRLIKFHVNLKYIALQRLLNYFMQEVFFLKIGWQ